MGDSATSPPAAGPNGPQGQAPSAPSDLSEVLKFLTEQAQKNRDALADQIKWNRDALSDQAEEDRKLLRHTLYLVSVPLTIVLALAGWFGIKDISAIEHRAQETLNQTLEQNKGRIAAEQKENQELLAGIKQESKKAEEDEIQKANGRLEERFDDAHIQSAIDDAAKTATSGKAEALIEQRVRTMIDPIVAKAQASVDEIVIQQLMTGVGADNAFDLDQLLLRAKTVGTEDQKRINGYLESERGIENKAVSERIFVGPSGESLKRCDDPEATAFRSAMSGDVVEVRVQAIAACYYFASFGHLIDGNSKRIPVTVRILEIAVPVLAEHAAGDKSVLVRFTAVYALNKILQNTPGFPKEGLDVFRPERLRQWWDSARKSVEALTVMGLYQEKANWNYTELYAELDRFAQDPPADLSQPLGVLRNQIQDWILYENSTKAPDLEKALAISACGDVNRKVASDLNLVPPKGPGADWNYDPAFLSLQLAATCPKLTPLEPAIADYAIATRNLAFRYAAITVINKWEGTSLDPFELGPIRSWIEEHKAQPSK